MSRMNASTPSRTILRGIGMRQVRLACALVLFCYLLSHFLNHALGIISLQALADGVYFHTAFWRFLPVAVVFYTAAIVHGGLGLWAVYQRRQFSWTAIEPLQLVLGLSIPLLIVSHIAGVRLGHILFGQDRLYPQVFYADWVAAPAKKWLMLTALTVAWIHGCIGLYFWLRMKAFYQRAAPFLLAAAVLIPILAMLGLYQGSRSVIAISGSAEWKAINLPPRVVGTPAQQSVLGDIIDDFQIGYLGLIGLVLLARGARTLNERRGGLITLSYGNGRTVRVPKGLSVLEASLRHNVPHASVCGGRARCSTCRIRVIGDCTSLPQPSPRFASAPHRAGALSRQHVRRHARLDQTRRSAVAVRHRVHRQPIPRRGIAGGDRLRRSTQPVRRRRTIGPVRARRRSTNRL
jgi:adenylate cyclase